MKQKKPLTKAQFETIHEALNYAEKGCEYDLAPEAKTDPVQIKKIKSAREALLRMQWGSNESN